jgi:predicted heme/steroid binding protein
MNIYTNSELSLRNGIHLPDIWVAYKGKIYDVTSSKLFAGGKHYRHSAGMDLTREMEDAPHIDEVFDKFKQVGILAAE